MRKERRCLPGVPYHDALGNFLCYVSHAGLDPWEFKVLEYRKQGTSRDEAMKRQPDEGSRKAIQAAWKSLDRTGWSKVRRILSEKAPEDVPEELSHDTRELEGSAAPYPKAATSGNPLQAAWKQSGGTSREDLRGFLIKYRRDVIKDRRARQPLWESIEVDEPPVGGILVKIIDSECPERAFPKVLGI